MNASGNLKQPVNPEKLLGNAFEKIQEQQKAINPEEQEKKLSDLKAKFGYKD